VAVEVKRKKGESFEALLRRFSKRMQESGRMIQAKKIRFHVSPKSKNAEREAAVRRIYLGARREFLIKSGQKTEEDFLPKRRRGR
jgi:ribosomal protein S21